MSEKPLRDGYYWHVTNDGEMPIIVSIDLGIMTYGDCAFTPTGKLLGPLSVEGGLATRLEGIIKEWERGCSCADPGKPEECPDCTRAAMDAIKASIQRFHTGEPQPEA